ncbi:MAG: hypothetical protein AB7S38_28730 [Vulcanimicrobiota bacterium]
MDDYAVLVAKVLAGDFIPSVQLLVELEQALVMAKARLMVAAPNTSTWYFLRVFAGECQQAINLVQWGEKEVVA